MIRALLAMVVCLAAHAQPAADAAYQRGSELYRAGNCPEAVKVLSQSQGTPRALLLSGRCYLDMGDYARARIALQQYNQVVRGDEEAAILQARAAQGAGDSAQALAALEELHRQSPASLAAADALADAYAKSGKPAQAVPLYQAVLKLQPEDIGALEGLAGLAASASQWAAAAEQYLKVLALSPENPAANAGMAQAQLQLGKVAGAIPYLQHAGRLRPDDWGLTRLLASCYFQTQKWPEIIQALEFNSLAHAEDEESTGWMVEAFSHTGDLAHAERYYRAVLQKAAGNFTARMTLANLLYDSKRAKDSKEQYVLVLKAKPDLFEISDRVGQIAEQEGDTSEAIQYYVAACRSAQATTAMKARLALLYFKAGDFAHARPALETVLAAEPDNRDVKTMLMQVAIKSGRSDDAVRYAGELLAGDPKNLALLRMLGEDALKKNKDADAAEYLERAFAVDATNKELRFELVEIYTNDAALHKLPRAFELMDEYVGLNPDDYEGYLLLANLYRRKQDPANAREYFTRGFNRMPPKPPARMSWAYNSLGLLLFSEGNYEEALANQLKAVGLNPNDANSEYNLALTYLKLRKKDEVNAARERLMLMGAPELMSALDEQIQKSRINETRK